jgi:hypothetical protein
MVNGQSAMVNRQFAFARASANKSALLARRSEAKDGAVGNNFG